MFTQSYQKQEQVPSDDFARTWKCSRAEKWQKLWFAEFSHCHPIQLEPSCYKEDLLCENWRETLPQAKNKDGASLYKLELGTACCP